MSDVSRAEFLDVQRKADFAKSTAVSAQRQITGLRQGNRQGRSPDPATQIVRSMAVSLKAMISQRPLADVAAHLYGEAAGAKLVEIANDPSVVSKAETNPAMTTVSGWAAELVGTALLPLALLSPLSVYGQLQRRASSLKVPFGPGLRSARLPALSPGDTPGSFLAEGQPIPVVKRTLSAAAMSVYKVGAISTFTKEMARNAAFEAIVRQIVAADLETVIDSVLLDANAATDIRPAGLRFGATNVPASTETGPPGVASDLSNLAGAVEGAMTKEVLVSIELADEIARLLDEERRLFNAAMDRLENRMLAKLVTEVRVLRAELAAAKKGRP
ncbi:hypothetical protein [Rhizobium sp. 007]|uniref:hypothetical protein n=1 Tax=Rhizobium sp. 007 TaxID=2785056 RepID=UPI00188E09F6|nr:hypothetical protein [Rhizobium sp. 007]QPB21118.1 hypothetical protein ISN39_06525 [Rhizobium sp. 007]